MFEIFEEEAVASASVAQVHKAKLWPKLGQKEGEGEWVAVKVQKPAVGKQMEPVSSGCIDVILIGVVLTTSIYC